MGVAPDGPLMAALLEEEPCTALQAVESLGNGCHGAVVGAIVDMLVDEGGLPPHHAGVDYTSSGSGIDVTADAVRRRYGDGMRHKRAAEVVEHRRRVLKAAWGLTEAQIDLDFEAAQARCQEAGDMWALTGDCAPFSSRHHSPHAVEQAQALRSLYVALDHARIAQPKVVMIENVDAPEVVDPITEFVTRIGGYRWRGAMLQPYTHAGYPVRRKRYYWVGVRRE